MNNDLDLDAAYDAAQARFPDGAPWWLDIYGMVDAVVPHNIGELAKKARAEVAASGQAPYWENQEADLAASWLARLAETNHD